MLFIGSIFYACVKYSIENKQNSPFLCVTLYCNSFCCYCCYYYYRYYYCYYCNYHYSISVLSRSPLCSSALAPEMRLLFFWNTTFELHARLLLLHFAGDFVHVCHVHRSLWQCCCCIYVVVVAAVVYSVCVVQNMSTG